MSLPSHSSNVITASPHCVEPENRFILTVQKTQDSWQVLEFPCSCVHDPCVKYSDCKVSPSLDVLAGSTAVRLHGPLAS